MRYALSRSLALIFLAAMAGAVIGRTWPRGAPKPQSLPLPSSTTPPTNKSGQDCRAEQTELASIQTQLNICLAFDPPPTIEEAPSPASLGEPQHPVTAENDIKLNRKRLKTYPEAVIVQHFDGRTGVYRPDDWPIDGEGIIVARKLPNGHIAWYSGPDAGPRSDPSAFQTSSASPSSELPAIERAADGTILVNGEPADNAVQRMFGGKIRPEHGDTP